MGFNVLTAKISHETNSFSIQETDEAAFMDRYVLLGDDAIKDDQFNGLPFGLHGAMDLNFCEDGEGELLRRVRAVVGEQMPIAVTLDPHANVSKQMCDLANFIVSFKTYPHIDIRDTGRQAGCQWLWRFDKLIGLTA